MTKGFGNRSASGKRPVRINRTPGNAARPELEMAQSTSFSGIGSALASIAGGIALFGIGYFASFHLTSSMLSSPYSEIDAKAPKSGIERVAYYQDKAAALLRKQFKGSAPKALPSRSRSTTATRGIRSRG